MCDYSLHNVKSRPAKVGDKLTTHHFNTGTRGFAAPEDANTAVCVLPGTELAFAREISCRPRSLLGWKAKAVNHTTAIFRQINKDDPRTHHDALEFPDGQIVPLTDLVEGQEASVLQLPAQPATAARRRPRNGSRTSADSQTARAFRPPSIGRTILRNMSPGEIAVQLQLVHATVMRANMRSILVAMMKSFSCSPLIFLVCSETVALPQPKLIFG